MKNFIISLCALCFALCVATASADEAKILFPGSVLPDDLPEFGQDLKGSKFLALHRVGGKVLLSEARVTYNGNTANISSDIKDPIVYVRRIALELGEVQEAIIRGNRDRYALESELEISLNDKTYTLYKKNRTYVLVGPKGESRLYPGRGFLRVVWAGDVDRDGELDLIIQAGGTDEKNEVDCLLLSSLAKRPNLVKEFACQVYSG